MGKKQNANPCLLQQVAAAMKKVPCLPQQVAAGLGPPEGPKPGPRGWAQAGPTWVGPSQAQVGGPKLGPNQKFGTQKIKKEKLSKSKSVLPKMSGRSGLVGKNPPGPIWGHLGQFFAWAGKIGKYQNVAYFPWWALAVKLVKTGKAICHASQWFDCSQKWKSAATHLCTASIFHGCRFF